MLEDIIRNIVLLTKLSIVKMAMKNTMKVLKICRPRRDNDDNIGCDRNALIIMPLTIPSTKTMIGGENEVGKTVLNPLHHEVYG